ncbi:crossover junction endodeoxyribonuclease RuvC [Klebsiella pneumoniae]
MTLQLFPPLAAFVVILGQQTSGFMMVMRLLNLTIKPQADAADALAAAICHAHASGSMSKLTVLNALGGMARGRSRSSSRRR